MKKGMNSKLFQGLILSTFLVLITSCSNDSDNGSEGEPSANEAPRLNGVFIVRVASGTTPPFVTYDQSLQGAYNYHDAEGDAEGETLFRWYRDGVLIDGAEDQTYVLTPQDGDKTIEFEVTPVALSGTLQGESASSTVFIDSDTVVGYQKVTVTDGNDNIFLIGESLIAELTRGGVVDEFDSNTTYQWYRYTSIFGVIDGSVVGGTAIPGATDPTYVLTDDDVGFYLKLVVTMPGENQELFSNSIRLNTAPSAGNLNLVASTPGYLLVGDTLSIEYEYADEEGDAEGATRFRWLRNGETIAGATSSSYTSTEADKSTFIQCEVTPVADSGETTGDPVLSSTRTVLSPPVVTPFAHYLDVNNNAVVDEGDQIVVLFDQPILTHSPSVEDFDLPVSGDGFGSGASLSVGPRSNSITITLGQTPMLTPGGGHSSEYQAGSPSGIDVSVTMSPDAIEAFAIPAPDAQASIAADIIYAFVDSNQSLGNFSTQSIAIGNLNDDVYPDLVSANADGSNRIYFNDGQGVFSDSGQLLGSENSQSIALADLDGDGDLDIAVANTTQQANQVYFNDGLGIYADSGQALGTGNSNQLLVGDIDNNGSPDLAVLNDDSSGVRFYINNGSGFFSESIHSLGLITASAIEFGAINGDGFVDLVVARRDEPTLIYLNNGDGSFSVSDQTFDPQNTGAVAVGDVDGDGDSDLVFGNGSSLTESNRDNSLYLNDGSGNFTRSALVIGSSITREVRLHDVDEDRDLDIVETVIGGIRVYHNDGNGLFQDTLQILDGSSSITSAALADLDADGDQDMAIGKASGLSNRVFLNSLGINN